MEKFQCELEDEHPSLDGSLPRKHREDNVTGAETVIAQLDVFNLKYQRLCENIRDKLKMIGEDNQDDPEIQVGFQNQFYLLYVTVTPSTSTPNPFRLD